MIGNDWIDKATGKRIYSTEDERYKYLDEPTPQHAGTSPFNIKVTTVGDELLLCERQVEGDRHIRQGSLFDWLGGTVRHRLYAQSTATGRFITSDYYMQRLPGVVEGVLCQTSRKTSISGRAGRRCCRRRLTRARRPTIGPGHVNYKGLGTRFPFASAGDAQEPNPAYYDRDHVDAVRRSAHA